MNVLVYPLTVAWTMVFGIAFLPALLVGMALWRRPADWVTRRLIWVYGRGWMAAAWPFVRFRTEGMARGTVPTPCVLVVNHASFLDTYCMAAVPTWLSDIVFAVRSWPFRMFWYTLFMRLAGYLDVEGTPWDSVMPACRRLLAGGAHVLFFPEGHRSRDGRLRRFHSGAFRLAVACGVPVVPLCVMGTTNLLPPGRRWLGPARVRIRALAAVDPGQFQGPLAHLRMRRAVRAMMAKGLAEMRAERE